MNAQEMLRMQARLSSLEAAVASLTALIMGTPAKLVREVTEAQIQEMQASWRRYAALKNDYIKAGMGDYF